MSQFPLCSLRFYAWIFIDIDIHSDEDFLQALSSDLDIPLLLNSNDDDLGLLSSCFDKSPDEILSEITPPGSAPTYDFNREFDELQHVDYTQWGPEAFPNLESGIKVEENLSPPSPIQRINGTKWVSDLASGIKVERNSSPSSGESYFTDSIKSVSPTPSASSVVSKGTDIKEEIIIDTPPVSPNSNERVLYDVRLINENIPKVSS